MNKYFTLRALIDDLMLTVRNNNISESEDLSRRQIEQWIHYYRAFLLKQDINKDREINPSYVQVLDNVALIEVPYYSLEVVGDSKCTLYRTVDDIPKPIDLHYGIGIISVTDLHNSTIQNMSKTRRKYNNYRKHTRKDYTWYYQPTKVYVEGCGPLAYIRINGIFEDPTEAGLLPDDPYPFPVDMIPALKQLILEKEFGIMLKLPSDDKNSATIAGLKPTNNE